MNECEDPVGADSVSPFVGVVGSEPFTKCSRIGAGVEIIFNPLGEDAGVESIHFLELPAGSRCEFDAVSAGRGWQRHSSSRISSILNLWPSSAAIAARNS